MLRDPRLDEQLESKCTTFLQYPKFIRYLVEKGTIAATRNQSFLDELKAVSQLTDRSSYEGTTFTNEEGNTELTITPVVSKLDSTRDHIRIKITTNDTLDMFDIGRLGDETLPTVVKDLFDWMMWRNTNTVTFEYGSHDEAFTRFVKYIIKDIWRRICDKCHLDNLMCIKPYVDCEPFVQMTRKDNTNDYTFTYCFCLKYSTDENSSKANKVLHFLESRVVPAYCTEMPRLIFNNFDTFTAGMFIGEIKKEKSTHFTSNFNIKLPPYEESKYSNSISIDCGTTMANRRAKCEVRFKATVHFEMQDLDTISIKEWQALFGYGSNRRYYYFKPYGWYHTACKEGMAIIDNVARQLCDIFPSLHQNDLVEKTAAVSIMFSEDNERVMICTETTFLI